MAIDAKAEALEIARRNTPDGYPDGCVLEISIAQSITSLVTRAVAEAKLKQMEADCRAACDGCKRGDAIEKRGGIYHHMHEQTGYPYECDALAIRTAFAATENQQENSNDRR